MSKNSSAQAAFISNMATVTIPNPSDVTPTPFHPPGRHGGMCPADNGEQFRDQREDQVFLVLTLLIGALVGLIVVAFILITERSGARLYPVGAADVAKNSCSQSSAR